MTYLLKNSTVHRMKSKFTRLALKALHNLAAIYLSKVLFCFVFLQSSTKTKAEYLLFDPMPHTFQHPAFIYDVHPPGFLPCVVQRTWGLKSIEFRAKPKYFQIMWTLGLGFFICKMKTMPHRMFWSQRYCMRLGLANYETSHYTKA